MSIEEAKKALKGSIVAIVTPMKNNAEDIDYDALQKLIEWHIAEGTHAILISGTTGESPTLRAEEYENLMEKSKKFCEGKIKLVCGSGTNSTHDSIKKTKLAEKHKMDAVLLVTPYYNCPTQDGLHEHFKKIAESCPSMPMILYNVPKRTGRDLLPPTVKRLSKIANIIGIKDATGSVERAEELMKITGDNFNVYSGDDDISCEVILRGGAGVISVAANVIPKQTARMASLALQKNSEEARRVNSSIAMMHKKLFVEPNPIPVKWTLAQMNKIQGDIRLPLLPLSEKFYEEVREAMKTSMQNN